MRPYKIHMAGSIFLLATVFISFISCQNAAQKATQKHQNHQVTIDAMAFSPADLHIQKGDTVTFINRDIVAHNATERKQHWVSPDLKTGEQWQIVPDASGDYFCSLHVVMEGHIEVE